MGNDVSVSINGSHDNPVPGKSAMKKGHENYLYCGTCGEWEAGSYTLGKEYKCFTAWCKEKITPLNYPPRPHYYHCLCGNIDVRDHYAPIPLGCSSCGDLVRPTLDSPKQHHFLCESCDNYWSKECYGNETEPCMKCEFEVVPRSRPPILWHFWCMCGQRGTQLNYKELVLDCTGYLCREKLVGRADPPQLMYYRCRSCDSYTKALGYTDVPLPCPSSECPAKLWPLRVPAEQHYLCDECWMYFNIHSEPNEELPCRRQKCHNIIIPSLQKPESIYYKEGKFIPPILQNDDEPKTRCYFLCRCDAIDGNYWDESSWNPTIFQYCERCKFDVYPFLNPLPNRQHAGYFSCNTCGLKWKSDKAYPDVSQDCKTCKTSVRPLLVEPKPLVNRGIVV